MTNAINAGKSIGRAALRMWHTQACSRALSSFVGACLEKVSIHSGKLADPALWQDLHRHSSSFQFNKGDILFIP